VNRDGIVMAVTTATATTTTAATAAAAALWNNDNNEMDNQKERCCMNIYDATSQFNIYILCDCGDEFNRTPYRHIGGMSTG
jgi:hypothetical protein